ncbi:MAG: DUF3137 domain-containing protein [Alphaproteobacteria bacterium]|nr:DUF3137 domain-containing protein [Alphaproteobacteria bacterium]
MKEHIENLEKLQSEFKIFYEKNLLEDYKRLEIIWRVYCICCSIIFFSCIGGLWFEFKYLCGGEIKLYTSKIMFQSIGLCAFVLFLPIYAFKHVYKTCVTEKVISFFDNIVYGENLICIDDIKQADLFSFFTGSTVFKCISGNYNGFEFGISEQILSYYKFLVVGGVRTLVYNGVLIKIHLNKKYINKIIGCYISKKNKSICDDCLLFFICILPLLIGVFWLKKYTILLSIPLIIYIICISIYKFRIRKEMAYSNDWKICATDENDIKYILFPELMNQMIEIKRIFKGNSIKFSFFDDNLLISIPKVELEKTTLFKANLKYENAEHIVKKIHSIYVLIDLLKFNVKNV